jgi:hypothetical protein
MTVIQALQLIGALFTVGKDIEAVIEAHRASGKADTEPLSPEHEAAVRAAVGTLNPLGDPDAPE